MSGALKSDVKRAAAAAVCDLLSGLLWCNEHAPASGAAGGDASGDACSYSL